tara:strand:+ start:13910 stop:16312 length:2403 start_codon:yes stop_codon:yes gene_type:complete
MSKNSINQLKDKLKDNPFPISDIDPKKKEEKSYGTSIAKHIYYKGVVEDVTSNARVNAQENRDYAANRQDINKYKGLLDAEIDNKGDTSYMNIDWSVQTPCKKYTDILVGDMVNQDHKIQFNAIDNESKKEITKARDEYYGAIARRDDIAEMEAMAGVTLEKKTEFNPSSREEVDIFMELEFKQAIEIGMETITDFELMNNDWDTKIKKRVIRDFVENNKGCVRLYFDRNNKISIRYVDAPLSYYSSSSDEPDDSDTEYQAEKVKMSIGNLRKRDVHNEITEGQWFDIAKSAAENNGNAKWRFGSNYSSTNNYNGQQYSYSDYRVEVLDFVFYTTDKYVYAEKNDKYGNKHTSRKSYGYKKPEGNRRKIEVIEDENEMSYEGIWVINSDILLGYERSRNILRPTKKKGESSSPKLIRRYVYFEPNKRGGVSTSFVETIKPNIDTIQILVLRKRHIIAEMNPTGVAVDVSGLSDVMKALKETDPMKIIKLYKQKGILYFSRTDVNGDPVNGLPVQELGSAFAQSLAGIDNAILNEIGHIRNNGGINESRDGSSQDKDALVGIEKMRLLASNNTTRETYKGFLDGVFAPIGRVVSRMVQYKVEYGDGIKEYENIIGEQGVKSVEFGKAIPMAQLGIKIEALPTDDQIEQLLGILNIALKNQEIRVEDYLEVKRVLNIKKAERLLIYRKKQYAKDKMEEFQQKEEITAKREGASAMAAAEAQKIKDQSKAEAQIAIDQNKIMLEMEATSHETMEKIKLIDRDYYWKEQLLEQQLKGGNEGDQGLNAPKIMTNPSAAAERSTGF